MNCCPGANDVDECQKMKRLKTSLKDWPTVFARIKRLRGPDEHEKVLFARSLAATASERWHMNETCLRSPGLWGPSALEKLDSDFVQPPRLLPEKRWGK